VPARRKYRSLARNGLGVGCTEKESSLVHRPGEDGEGSGCGKKEEFTATPPRKKKKIYAETREKTSLSQEKEGGPGPGGEKKRGTAPKKK